MHAFVPFFLILFCCCSADGAADRFAGGCSASAVVAMAIDCAANCEEFGDCAIDWAHTIQFDCDRLRV
jgi:hypothetical protein